MHLSCRQDLVDYYREITQEAEGRADRAVWRVKRMQLNEQRQEFFRKEEESLAAELATNPLPPEVRRNGDKF